MKAYLLVTNPNFLSGHRATSAIDRIPAVTNWMLVFDNTLILISDLSSSELGSEIRDAAGTGQFIVTELRKGQRNGWLPRAVWTFINNPESASGA